MSLSNRRRSFLAVLTGAAAMLTPLAAGVVTFFTPLFRKSGARQVRVALLSQVPDDGLPRFFPVVDDRTDAWNRYPQQRLGAVYLVRQPGAAKPTALTARCPHAGCFVGYVRGDDRFRCPCHTSEFLLDGSRARGDDEVAPRGMDALDVNLKEIEIDGQQAIEVRVAFLDYQTGHKEKLPAV